jgi:hypothetical protein
MLLPAKHVVNVILFLVLDLALTVLHGVKTVVLLANLVMPGIKETLFALAIS